MTSAEYLKRPYSRVLVPESDGTFRGEILEFPGCIAAGDTAQDTLAKLEDVAESWLEAVLARKQQVPEPGAHSRNVGAPVIEITSAMLSAGVAALQEWHDGIEDWPAGARSIYEAMVNARSLGQNTDKAEKENVQTRPQSNRPKAKKKSKGSCATNGI